MSMPLWIVGLIKKTFGQRFLLAKLTNVPIVGSAIDRALFDGDRILYLPQNKVIHSGASIEDPSSVVLPSRVVDHFIEKANYRWIMNECICRAASGCRDYPTDLGCIFLGEAAMGINPKLGRAVGRDEAIEHAEKCRRAGLVHLVGRNKLDTVWLNVKPGNRLLTICNCCQCCCLWRMLPDVSPEIGGKVTGMPGVVVEVTERCEGCGTCAQDVCFVDAVKMVQGKSVISDACRGCGRCVAACPHDAIELKIEDPAAVEKAIESLAGLVDVT